MVIGTNQASLKLSRLLGEANGRLSRSLARLSSGARIDSPEVDSAGLAVATKLGAQTRDNNAAAANLQNAISYTMTQDGYLQKIQKALTRMSELTVLAQDETKTDADRVLYNEEFRTLREAVNNYFRARFNGVQLFTRTLSNTINGTFSGGDGTDTQTFNTVYPNGTVSISFDHNPNPGGANAKLRVVYGGTELILNSNNIAQGSLNVPFDGAFSGNSTQLEIIVNDPPVVDPGMSWSYDVTITSFQPERFSVTTDGKTSDSLIALPQTEIGSVGVDNLASAVAAQDSIQSFLNTVAEYRAKTGANLAKLQMNYESLSVLNENLSAATSRIMDADVAQESTHFARSSILVQSSSALLAQANVLPESALTLLS